MIAFPRGVEREVARRLLQRLRVLETLLIERIEADSSPAEIVAAIEATRRALDESIRRLPAAMPRHALAVATQTQAAILDEIKRQAGVDMADDIRLGALSSALSLARAQWTRRIAELVAKAEREALDRLRAQLGAGTSNARGIVKAEAARLRGRLQLIARSEVGSLQATVSEGTQRALGIDSYVWESQGDSRVRDLHRELDGDVRRWDNPHPTEGHPGQAVGCRCVARPSLVTTGKRQPAPPRARQPATRRPPAPLPPAPPPPPIPPARAPAPPPAPPVAPKPAPPLAPARVATLDLSGVNLTTTTPSEIRRALGRSATPEEILSWAGVAQQDLAGARVSIEIIDDQVHLEVDADRFVLVRQYGLRDDGTLYAHHDLFEVGKQYQGAGLGSDMFLRQVAALRAAGFREIETLAAGENGHAVFNGYYTWPRLGYDGPLSPKILAVLPPQFAGAEQVSDLMATAAGRAWWRENGAWIDVVFDLLPDSYSSKVLEAYLAEKAAKARGDKRDERTDASKAARRHGQEEIDLNEAEAEAADRALDRVATSR